MDLIKCTFNELPDAMQMHALCGEYSRYCQAKGFLCKKRKENLKTNFKESFIIGVIVTRQERGVRMKL